MPVDKRAPWNGKTADRRPETIEVDEFPGGNGWRFFIDPVSKPRQTQRDKWNPSKAVQKYRLYADRLRAGFKKAGLTFPDSSYHLTFIVKMPKSWSKAKRAEHDGQPHRAKPDKDNLEKAVLDALHKEDSHVWDGRVTKRWGEIGMVTLRLNIE